MSLIPKSILPQRPKAPAPDAAVTDTHTEFEAQKAIYNALKKLKPVARERVKRYVDEKIAEEEKPRE